MKELRILIADDHDVVRQGLRLLIEKKRGWSVCGEAGTGREAVKMVEQLKPDVAVLDMSMPELNGLDAARQIKRRSSHTEVVLFSGGGTEEIIRDAFTAGARSFLAKSDAASHFVAALEAVSMHKPYFTPEVAEIVFQRFTGAGAKPAETPGAVKLSEREHEIVQLLVEGNSNKEIAAKLSVSNKTIEGHRANIMRKLKLTAFSELVRWAIRNKVIEA